VFGVTQHGHQLTKVNFLINDKKIKCKKIKKKHLNVVKFYKKSPKFFSKKY
jgi:hypothetical protein